MGEPERRAYNIVEGVNLTERERGLREALLTVIGKKVPQRLYNVLTSVLIRKPKDMTQEQWDKINKDREYFMRYEKEHNGTDEYLQFHENFLV